MAQVRPRRQVEHPQGAEVPSREEVEVALEALPPAAFLSSGALQGQLQERQEPALQQVLGHRRRAKWVLSDLLRTVSQPVPALELGLP